MVHNILYGNSTKRWEPLGREWEQEVKVNEAGDLDPWSPLQVRDVNNSRKAGKIPGCQCDFPG